MEKIKDIIFSVLKTDIDSVTEIGGGCIASAYKVTTSKGKFFLKNYQTKHIAVCEANGINELRKANKIRVPEVIWFDENYLLLEFIEEGRRGNNFWEKFGSQLAELHKYKSNEYGFYENNFIGTTLQVNLPKSQNWKNFYWENRILFQIKLAEKNGYLTDEMIRLIKNVELNLDDIIPDKEEISLIHGDLWSGNFLCDNSGNAVLIDPAVSYSNREAELGMTMLFGGFDGRFYQAYNETFPLEKEWKYRNDFYQLYHVLNHLNLFGSGYYSQAIRILKKYA